MEVLSVYDVKELFNASVAIVKHSNYFADAVYNATDALDCLETGVYELYLSLI